MNGTRQGTWMAALLVAAFFATAAEGAMIGIGREGSFAIEIFAERSEVVRGTGTAQVSLPREAENLFLAADVRQGDWVWTGDTSGNGGAPASVVSLVPGWWSCTLKLKETSRPATAPVERFHLLRWADLGGRFAVRLDALARTNEAAYRSGLGEVLSQVGAMFGGQDMVAGFPGTKYAAEFGNVRRAFDRCVRRGQMRGFAADRTLKAGYRTLFGADWPVALRAVFGSGDEGPLEIRRILGADGQPLADVFEQPLPIRLEGTNRVEGALPAGMALQIAYAPAGGGGVGEETVFSWRADEDGELPVLFLFQSCAENGSFVFSTNRIENAGNVAVSVRIGMGGNSRTCTLPVSERLLLCLVTRPGTALKLEGEPDASDLFARDWTVSVRQDADSVIRFASERKAVPELVLSNPEMMPVDVTVTYPGGGWGSAKKRTLRAGETGVSIPVPAHKPLDVAYRFHSDFHKAGKTGIPPLFYGDRSNLVLRAELKGDPEVIVLNTGPVAVRLAGMASPPEGVEIPAGKTATVTVPVGRRVLLTGTALSEDYQCDPVSVSAMESGATATVKLCMKLKPAPQVVLRNVWGLMNVEATLMSATRRPLGKPVSLKRGESSRPIVLPSQSNLYFRLVFNKDTDTMQGRMPVPSIPHGTSKILDVPSPSEAVRNQKAAEKAATVPSPPPPSGPAVPKREPVATDAASPVYLQGTGQ